MNKTGLNKDTEMEFVGKKLYVKYMVSLRCKMIAKSVMEDLALHYKICPHGALEFDEGMSEDQYEGLKKGLKKAGMVLLNESESMLIDKIINTIVEIIHYTDQLPKIDFTDVISEHAVLGQESILKIFSDVKGVSVLQFIVIQKIERVKELILYDDMPLTEIAEILNYKDKHYLLAQFKKVTGLTPHDFKRIKKERLKIKQKSQSHSRNANVSGIKGQPDS